MTLSNTSVASNVAILPNAQIAAIRTAGFWARTTFSRYGTETGSFTNPKSTAASNDPEPAGSRALAAKRSQVARRWAGSNSVIVIVKVRAAGSPSIAG